MLYKTAGWNYKCTTAKRHLGRYVWELCRNFDVSLKLQAVWALISVCLCQYEVVTGPLPPLEAADALIFTRETIYNIASKHNLRATFAPRVYDDSCTSQLSAQRLPLVLAPFH